MDIPFVFIFQVSSFSSFSSFLPIQTLIEWPYVLDQPLVEVFSFPSVLFIELVVVFINGPLGRTKLIPCLSSFQI